MTVAAYHFERIHSAASSEDGENVILNVTGADGGICGISLPTKTIPHVCMTILEANSEALRRTGSKIMQSTEIKGLKILKHPDPNKAVVAITIHSGAAPMAFDLPRTLLADFARGVLEGQGLLKVDIPSKPQ